MSPKPPNILSLEQYMKKLAAIVRESPALAPLAYTKAAAHVRSLANKPENKGRGLEIQAIACKLDQMAAEAIIPETDPVDAEIISPWSDDPSGQIATEFDGVVADFAAAKVGPDGLPVSDLAHSAQFEHFQKERDREEVPPVQITPEGCDRGGNKLSDTVLVQFGGTSGSGSYVNSGGVAGPVVAKQEDEVIRWDGRESQPVPCRVSISRLIGGVNATFPTGANAAGNTFSYRPFFRARWGSGSRGTANEVLGDVGRGIQFTVVASHLYVNVGMDSFTVNPSGISPSITYAAGSMYLNGHLGFYTGESTAPVTRTIYIDQLGSTATTTITIPLFAQALLPPQCSVSSVVMQLDFQDPNGQTVGESLQFAAGSVVGEIPIPNDAFQILVTNISGGAAAYRLIFKLAL